MLSPVNCSNINIISRCISLHALLRSSVIRMQYSDQLWLKCFTRTSCYQNILLRSAVIRMPSSNQMPLSTSHLFLRMPSSDQLPLSTTHTILSPIEVSRLQLQRGCLMGIWGGLSASECGKFTQCWPSTGPSFHILYRYLAIAWPLYTAGWGNIRARESVRRGATRGQHWLKTDLVIREVSANQR